MGMRLIYIDNSAIQNARKDLLRCLGGWVKRMHALFH